MKGLDGEFWTSHLCGNGSYRWVRSRTTRSTTKPAKRATKKRPTKVKRAREEDLKAAGIPQKRAKRARREEVWSKNDSRDTQNILDKYIVKRIKQFIAGLEKDIGKPLLRVESTFRNGNSINERHARLVHGDLAHRVKTSRENFTSFDIHVSQMLFTYPEQKYEFDRMPTNERKALMNLLKIAEKTASKSEIKKLKDAREHLSLMIQRETQRAVRTADRVRKTVERTGKRRRKRSSEAGLGFNPCEKLPDKSLTAEPRCAGREDPVSKEDIAPDKAMCYGKTCFSTNSYRDLISNGSRWNGHVLSESDHDWGLYNQTSRQPVWDQKKQAFMNGEGKVKIEGEGIPGYGRHAIELRDLSEGGTYEGGFKDGLMHGEGVFRWHDGAIYKGKFDKGSKSWEGQYTRPDGSTYTKTDDDSTDDD